MHRAAAVAVVLLLVGTQPAAAIGSATADGGPERLAADGTRSVPAGERVADGADTATIEVDTVLSLTPARPGSIGVVQTFDTPESVTALSVTLGPESTVIEAEGFSHAGGQTWEWDGETADPRLRYWKAANRTTDRQGPMGAEGSYLYADVGEWALVRQPNVGLQWRYHGVESVSVARSVRVDGEGAVGGSTAFLGPHETYTREVADQEFRLIVPDDAALADPPERILDAFGNASRALQVGDRDATVFAVAAPTGRVNWAVQGVQVGDTDFWVRANQPVDAVGNAWLHEYVHTRQSFRTADSGRWFTEASATWYAALLSYQQEGVAYRTFSQYLARGTGSPQDEAVLADPTAWVNNAEYWKGALVTGEIDRRLRLTTDGGATLQRVLASLNDRTSPVTNEDVLAAVGRAGTQSTREAAERLTTTSDVPAVWNRSRHHAAFGGDTALLRTRFDPATDVRATGPYRNTTVGAPVSLAVGERLAVRTVVENLGSATGAYAVTLRVDDAAVATADGSLAPDGTATATLAHRFDEPGRYTVSVAGERFTVEVRAPATPTVTDVTVAPTTVAVGGDVTVTATVTNEASVPGNATVAFTRDGGTVTTRTVTVAPGERETVTATVGMPARGDHAVGAGERTAEVRVVESTAVTGTSVPGFGVPVAVVAVLVALGLRRRR